MKALKADREPALVSRSTTGRPRRRHFVDELEGVIDRRRVRAHGNDPRLHYVADARRKRSLISTGASTPNFPSTKSIRSLVLPARAGMTSPWPLRRFSSA